MSLQLLKPKLSMGLTSGGFDRFLSDGGGVDFRLNESCWQSLNQGDVFEFIEDLNGKRRYCVEILHLYTASNFSNLIDSLPSDLFDPNEKTLYLDFFSQWWTLEQQLEDGVLGLHVKVLQDSLNF